MSRIFCLFMCVFASLPSHCLKVWLCLLLSPVAHIPNGKKKYNFTFQKHSASVCSCFQWEQGLARAQRLPSQSMLENKGQRTLILLLKNYRLAFQARCLWLFLLLSTHPWSRNRSFLFSWQYCSSVLVGRHHRVAISRIIIKLIRKL